uniref:Uncharacterized protein n=1 Tax=Arundo donax TaxID=35708 RepID=A0A0A8YPY0_ARUDO
MHDTSIAPSMKIFKSASNANCNIKQFLPA